MPVMYLDESEHGDFLSVGGYYCWTRDVPRIESAWRGAKQRLGLDPDSPLTWSPQDQVQQALNPAGGVEAARRVAAVVIGDLPLEVVAIILQERRGEYYVVGTGPSGAVGVDVATWKEIYPKGGGVRHFYLRGVEFATQRFADHVGAISREQAEPSRLVLDDLGWARNPGKMIRRLRAELVRLPETEAWVIRDWMERGVEAAHDAYARWYRTGFTKPYKHLGSLAALGFESSFYQCHDMRSDAMQVADFVAGCLGAFVSDLSRGKSGVAQNCVRALRNRIRAGGSISFRRWGMWGNGFVLWPRNQQLWNKAKVALT